MNVGRFEIALEDYYDLNAEAVVLMDLFLAADDVQRRRTLLQQLSEYDFGRDLHRWVFSAIHWLDSKSLPVTPQAASVVAAWSQGVDPASVWESCRQLLWVADIATRIEWDEDCAGLGFKAALMRPVDYSNWAMALKRSTRRRGVIDAAMRIIDLALEDKPVAGEVAKLQRQAVGTRARGGIYFPEV